MKEVHPVLAFTKRRPPRSRRPRAAERIQRFRPAVEQLEDSCLLSVDPILEWNAVALEANRVSYSGGVVNDQEGPTRSSCALAIAHVAMFDAWNSINRKFTPYLVQA